MRAIVQLRGEVNQSEAVRDTLGMLNLHRVNHATLVPETAANPRRGTRTSTTSGSRNTPTTTASRR